jgi:regulator of protease activity HflC (stomatin/prohibitin superfamily)
VPAVVALLFVYSLAGSFVGALYKAESAKEARAFLRRCLFGQPSFGPWIRITEGASSGKREHLLHRIGGPGSLVIYTDSAVVTECAGRLTHVHHMGFPHLERFEKMYQIVDLRPKRSVHAVEAMSREGIPITCEADISYEIEKENVAPTKEKPFPVSDETVLRAVTASWIREADRPEDSRTLDWAGRVIISETEAGLRSIVSKYPLDQLIGLGFDGSNPREEIRQALEKELRAAAPTVGARILKVDLGDFKVAHEITQQWIDAWRSTWESWATKQKALGRAKQIEQMERAKTQAQVMMLKAIIDALEPLQAEGQAASVQMVLDRMFMVMSRAAADPLTRVYLPREAAKTLQMLQEMCGGQSKALPAPGP